MRGTARTVAIAGVTLSALLAAGCGGGLGGSSGGSGTDGGKVTVRGCNPQGDLIPGNTAEVCGGNVLDAISAKLVHYNSATAAPENDIAKSIETTDNQNFRVTLVKGYKFQDGSEVRAKNFVNAWNYAAYGPNAQSNGYFMEPIQGYDDLQSEDPDGNGPQAAPLPKAKRMSGLKVVDDFTFTIKTSAKVSNLPVRLGYIAFAPLPGSFFRDPKAYGEKPIGAGPFKFDSWSKGQDITLSRFDGYSGKFPASVDGLVFKIYPDADTAYNDVVANALDITDEVPTSALIDDRYKQELPDRNAQKAAGVIQTLTFPPAKVDANYTSLKLRQAISMSINREEIVKQIFNGGREVATGWVSPVVDGFKANACGEYCTFNPTRAKQLYREAGGFKGAKITLSYNADASHRDWAEASCNSIHRVLGVDCIATPVVDLATFRKQVTDRKMKGIFRTGWQMDYPSIENFLSPIFRTGASSNDGDYSSKQFDTLTDEAAAQTDPAAANAKYQEAERVLAADLPTIPLWFQTATFGWSDRVTNVKITPFGTLDVAAVKLK